MRNIRRAQKQTYFKLWMPEARPQHVKRVLVGRNVGLREKLLKPQLPADIARSKLAVGS
jgi:hypothetical protein